MKFENQRYVLDQITAEQSRIEAVVDGAHMSVPIDPDDRFYAELMRQVDEEGLVIEQPAHPTHAELRENAKARIQQAHATFIRDLTGNATIEERDTWKTKEEAARAYVAGTADVGQTALIELEAQGDQTIPADLANVILAKAQKYQILIGTASGLKNKAFTAINQATDESVPIENVPALIEAAFEQINQLTAEAVANWHAENPS